MKLSKLFFMFVLLASGLMLGSCSDDDDSTPESKMRKITLYGIFSEDAKSMGVPSRIALDKATKAFLWQKGDKVVVYGSNQEGYELTLGKGEGTNYGVFAGDVPDGFVPKKVAFKGKFNDVYSVGLERDLVEDFTGGTLQNVFAVSTVTSAGTGGDTRYSFCLQHQIGYAVFEITNAADASWDGNTVNVQGDKLFGNAKVRFSDDNITVTWNGNNSKKDFDIKCDGTQIVAVAPGGKITGIKANGIRLWSGSKTVEAGKIINFKKDFNVSPN